MALSRLESAACSRKHTSLEPLSARAGTPGDARDALPWALEQKLACVSAPPIEADAVVIALEPGSSQRWTALAWSRDADRRVHDLPEPPASSWLWSVVEHGTRWLQLDASESAGGFPWLPGARSWLALPLEAGAGQRRGAIAVATRRERDWSLAAERRLLEIVADPELELDRLWLTLELSRAQADLAQATRDTAQARERRDTMLAVLGHELRNPLAPLTNALELLWNRAPSGMHAELSVMDRQLRQLRRLVDDLLDLSRVFRGDLTLDLQRVRLRDVVRAAADNVQSAVAERNHMLAADVPPELSLRADEARLTQVLTVLLSNAAKHTPRGRHIDVSARSLGETIELLVEDDGGVDPQALEAAFEPFHGRRSQGLGAGGLGLGLPIARALALRHGGELDLYSQGPGQGTRAVLRLPKAGSIPPPPPQPRAKRSTPRMAHSVLVVDDNRDAADMLADAIRSWGGRATVAYEPRVALELAKQARFDVALVDIAMPEMNGLELARELRRLPLSHGLRIIAISGFGEPADAERSLEAGMDAHLVKPLGLRDLFQVLADVTAPVVRCRADTDP